MTAAKYQLLVAAEAAMDICGHFSAKRLGKAPEGYADCFRILADAGAITRDLSQHLTAMARFRNLLLHQYGDIDDHRLYRILQENLGDLEQYLVDRQNVDQWAAATLRIAYGGVFFRIRRSGSYQSERLGVRLGWRSLPSR